MFLVQDVGRGWERLMRMRGDRIISRFSWEGRVISTRIFSRIETARLIGRIFTPVCSWFLRGGLMQVLMCGV